MSKLFSKYNMITYYPGDMVGRRKGRSGKAPANPRRVKTPGWVSQEDSSSSSGGEVKLDSWMLFKLLDVSLGTLVCFVCLVREGSLKNAHI